MYYAWKWYEYVRRAWVGTTHNVRVYRNITVAMWKVRKRQIYVRICRTIASRGDYSMIHCKTSLFFVEIASFVRIIINCNCASWNETFVVDRLPAKHSLELIFRYLYRCKARIDSLTRIFEQHIRFLMPVPPIQNSFHRDLRTAYISPVELYA